MASDVNKTILRIKNPFQNVNVNSLGPTASSYVYINSLDNKENVTRCTHLEENENNQNKCS